MRGPKRPPHTLPVVTVTLFKFQLVQHPPYPTDLAPSNYFIIRKKLIIKRFWTMYVFAGTELIRLFCGIGLTEGINNLKQRWTKCVGLKE